MSDFEKEVTLKLRTRMRTVERQVDGKRSIQLEAIESIELWRPGKRKPVAVLVNEGGRAECLRDVAHWIETNDDPELIGMEAKMAESRTSQSGRTS